MWLRHRHNMIMSFVMGNTQSGVDVSGARACDIKGTLKMLPKDKHRFRKIIIVGTKDIVRSVRGH